MTTLNFSADIFNPLLNKEYPVRAFFVKKMPEKFRHGGIKPVVVLSYPERFTYGSLTSGTFSGAGMTSGRVRAVSPFTG